MEERYEYPPNIDEIVAVLPAAKTWKGPVFFSWGEGVVFNPKKAQMDPPLIAHETVHGVRQGKTEESIREWWQKYCKSPEFRFEEELLAHRAEYELFCQVRTDKNQRFRFVRALAKRLSSPLYGRITTYLEARNLIQSKQESFRF